MSTIITRAGKGSPLTNDEVDTNFNNLNSTKVETSAVGTLSTQNANAVAVTGGAISGTSITVADNVFTLQDNLDPTKQAQFQLSGIGTGVTATYTMPAVTGTIPALNSINTWTATNTFSAATNTLGSSAATGTSNVGSGSTSSGNTKNVNIGTGGLSGSTTNITVGATAGTSTTTMNGQTDIGGTTTSVNFARITGAATTAAPTLSAQGSDANINLKLTPKGTGTLQFGTYTATVLSPTGFITITDAGGTSRRLLVG